MNKIFKANTWEEGYNLGVQFEKDLSKINLTAAKSWAEAFPEVITILQIKDKELRVKLATTNAIESLFSAVRTVTGRVKRWKNANQALYWTAGAYLRVKPNIRRIRGFRSLKELDSLKPFEQLTKELAA